MAIGRIGGLRTCIYHVPNLKEATEWYSKIFETQPYFLESFYAGFDIEGYELGLMPLGNKELKPGNTVATYWSVENIYDEYDRLLENGATENEKPLDVGEGVMVASVFDPWSNLLGIIYNPFFRKLQVDKNEQPKVTALGGIFFKSPDPEKLKEWYQNKLGIISSKYGGSFEWTKVGSEESGFTAWSIMGKDSEYFNPGQQEYMINYRVNNLDKLLENLKADGVELIGETESFEYGKFGWIMDPDGNKVELWEPNDDFYDKMTPERMKSK